MSLDELFEQFKSDVIIPKGANGFIGEFYFLNENASKKSRKYFRLYNLYMQKEALGFDLETDSDGNVIGIGNQPNQYCKDQAEVIVELIKQGWLKYEPITDDEYEELMTYMS